MKTSLHIQKYFSAIFSVPPPSAAELSIIQKPYTPNIKGEHYNIIPSTIRENIEREMKNTYISQFKFRGRKFTIYLSTKEKYGAGVSTEITEEFKKIYHWLFIVSGITDTKKKCSPEIDIYIYFTDLKKEFPAAAEGGGRAVLSPEHINTAYTFPCVHSKNEIHLFRHEEWFKVLIHETFHCFGLDFASISDGAEVERANSIIEKEIPVFASTQKALWETYTEIFAELLAMGFCRGGGKFRETDIENEKVYSVLQSYKILKHNGMTYKDVFSPAAVSTYKEETPVFCYYILKSILWIHLDEFLDWCSKNIKNTLQINDTKIAEFAQFLMEHKQTEKYMDYIELIENFKPTPSPREGDTLKMMYMNIDKGKPRDILMIKG